MNKETENRKPKVYPNRIPELLDYEALEYYYGLKKSTISKKVMLGTFCNIVKNGRKNMFRKEKVEAWINDNTIEVA